VPINQRLLTVRSREKIDRWLRRILVVPRQIIQNLPVDSPIKMNVTLQRRETTMATRESRAAMHTTAVHRFGLNRRVPAS
jgi:hypothetical protein